MMTGFYFTQFSFFPPFVIFGPFYNIYKGFLSIEMEIVFNRIQWIAAPRELIFWTFMCLFVPWVYP